MTDKFITDYGTDLRPKGSIERALHLQIMDADWNLRRLMQIETYLLDAGLNPFFTQSSDIRARFDAILRYKTHYDKVFHRSWKEFKALQNHRTMREAEQKRAPSSPEQPLTPQEEAELENLYAAIDQEKQEVEALVN